MLAAGGWLFNEVQVLARNQQQVLEWKSTIPDRMKSEAETLRLTVLKEVAATLGVALGNVQQSQVRIEQKLINISEKLDNHMEDAKK
jgi:hypothetical protein